MYILFSFSCKFRTIISVHCLWGNTHSLQTLPKKISVVPDTNRSGPLRYWENSCCKSLLITHWTQKKNLARKLSEVGAAEY